MKKHQPGPHSAEYLFLCRIGLKEKDETVSRMSHIQETGGSGLTVEMARANAEKKLQKDLFLKQIGDLVEVPIEAYPIFKKYSWSTDHYALVARLILGPQEDEHWTEVVLGSEEIGVAVNVWFEDRLLGCVELNNDGIWSFYYNSEYDVEAGLTLRDLVFISGVCAYLNS